MQPRSNATAPTEFYIHFLSKVTHIWTLAAKPPQWAACLSLHVTQLLKESNICWLKMTLSKQSLQRSLWTKSFIVIFQNIIIDLCYLNGFLNHCLKLRGRRRLLGESKYKQLIDGVYKTEKILNFSRTPCTLALHSEHKLLGDYLVFKERRLQ